MRATWAKHSKLSSVLFAPAVSAGMERAPLADASASETEVEKGSAYQLGQEECTPPGKNQTFRWKAPAKVLLAVVLVLAVLAGGHAIYPQNPDTTVHVEDGGTREVVGLYEGKCLETVKECCAATKPCRDALQYENKETKNDFCRLHSCYDTLFSHSDQGHCREAINDGCS